MECATSRKGGCGKNSKLTRLVAHIDSEYDYFLFIGINEDHEARIQVDFEVTCADDCGTINTFGLLANSVENLTVAL